MAKNFPYFKFVATEWLTGDIVFEDFELQGIFINVCALYWHRDGKVSLDEVVKRLKNERVNSLKDAFFTVDEYGFISIKFLDEQLIEANHISKINSLNGKKGAEAKRNKATAKRWLSDPSANLSKEEEEEEEKKRKEEAYRKFKHLCMTSSEFDKVFALGYTKKQIDNVLNSIQNYKKNTNYNDLYLTCLKWIRKEYPNVESPEVKKTKGTITNNFF